MLCGGVRLCAETAEKPYFKRFSGIEKVHRNSIKITVDLWWSIGDSSYAAAMPCILMISPTETQSVSVPGCIAPG